jgi:hypothetical protein
MLDKTRKSNTNAQEKSQGGRPKGKSIDTSRGIRLGEECERIFKIDRDRMQRHVGRELGYAGNTVGGWLGGSSIDSNALARLDELGADVKYILTGNTTPTGDCLKGKLCETLPTWLRLHEELLSAACSDNPAEAEDAASILEDVSRMLRERLQVRAGHG